MGERSRRMAKLQSVAKNAFADLLDQKSPFGKLALLHMVMIAGDTLVTISLAGSLFFSISMNAARGHVILYLLLTMAPFAVVAPFLGPILDRGRHMRRTMVISSGIARVVICFFMAGDIKSLFLFPEAFGLLVASKVYVVTRGALVPDMVPADTDLASANARLAFLASIAGMTASIPGALILELIGAGWVLRLDIFVFAAAAILGVRLKRLKKSRADIAFGPSPDDEDIWNPGEKGATGGIWSSPQAFLALSAMSVLRGEVGFMTFLIAFALKDAKAATYWYGAVLATSAIGGLLGTVIVPYVRRRIKEEQILLYAMIVITLSAAVAAFVGGLGMESFLTFSVGLNVSLARPSLDSLVQNHVPVEAQGRAFARVETQLQLVWVLGSLLAVVVAMPITAGEALIAAVASVGAASYLTGRRAIFHQQRNRE
ncbi:MAG: MFS transporter [Acidimicrobiales bacterium]|nr:MFS transporter [Acidimicrobiales bacterium]